MSSSFDIPILFIIFNRPDTANKVFEQIAKMRPRYLYIAADGPRKDNDSDKIRCEETRRIVEKVNWDCQLRTRFLENNYGCGRAVSSALSWFFSNEEEGIILEDDCYPDLSFFNYCQELLIKYRYEDSVFLIGGNSYQDNSYQAQTSYYFSNYPHIWGWASWRRAWQYYDFDMISLNDSIKNGKLDHVFQSKGERWHNLRIFEKVRKKKINTWDYQWVFSIWKEGGMAITPWYNMVENIGITNNSTHFFLKDKYRDNLTAKSISFPLVHPPMEINKIADKNSYKNLYSHSLQRAFRILKENDLTDIIKYLIKVLISFVCVKRK